MTSGKSPSPTRRIPAEAVPLPYDQLAVTIAVAAGCRTFGEIAADTGISKSLLNVPLRLAAGKGLLTFEPGTRGSIRPLIWFVPLRATP